MTTIFNTLPDNYIMFEKHIINIIIDTNDILWFNASDLTIALGYDKPKHTIQQQIDTKDKIQLQDINHNYNIKKHPQSIYINETGLYALVLRSKKPTAKKFTSWITEEVLPSIRKYGYYKMKTKYEQDKSGLLQQINYLQTENKKMESNLKKNKYPNGAVVYVIDYSDEDTTLPGIYRLGMTKNLKARKVLYNTHSFNNKPLAHYQEISNPVRFESCVRTMLYNYRHRDNKDFFVCSLAVIKKAFKKCSETLKSMNNVSQSGGGDNSSIIDITLTKLEKKLNVINKNITKYNKLLE